MKKQKCNYCDKKAKYYVVSDTITTYELFEIGKDDTFLDVWDNREEQVRDEYWCKECAEKEDLI